MSISFSNLKSTAKKRGSNIKASLRASAALNLRGATPRFPLSRPQLRGLGQWLPSWERSHIPPLEVGKSSTHKCYWYGIYDMLVPSRVTFILNIFIHLKQSTPLQKKTYPHIPKSIQNQNREGKSLVSPRNGTRWVDLIAGHCDHRLRRRIAEGIGLGGKGTKLQGILPEN